VYILTDYLHDRNSFVITNYRYSDKFTDKYFNVCLGESDGIRKTTDGKEVRYGLFFFFVKNTGK